VVVYGSIQVTLLFVLSLLCHFGRCPVRVCPCVCLPSEGSAALHQGCGVHTSLCPSAPLPHSACPPHLFSSSYSHGPFSSLFLQIPLHHHHRHLDIGAATHHPSGFTTPATVAVVGSRCVYVYDTPLFVPSMRSQSQYFLIHALFLWLSSKSITPSLLALANLSTSSSSRHLTLLSWLTKRIMEDYGITSCTSLLPARKTSSVTDLPASFPPQRPFPFYVFIHSH
jgi:hypothetical protein